MRKVHQSNTFSRAQANMDKIDVELKARGGYTSMSAMPSVNFDKMEFEFNALTWRLKRNRWIKPDSPNITKRCIWYAVRQVDTAWERVYFGREYGMLVESLWVERSMLEESK